MCVRFSNICKFLLFQSNIQYRLLGQMFGSQNGLTRTKKSIISTEQTHLSRKAQTHISISESMEHLDFLRSTIFK